MAKYITSIALGVDFVTGLTLRPLKKDNLEIAAATLIPREDEGPEEHAATLKTLAKSLRAAEAGTLLSMPRQWGLARMVQLPSVDPDELTQMARFEAQRHIPFNADRHHVGYHVVSKKGVEGSDVLLGAIDGPVIDSAVNAASGAGFQVKGATLSSCALFNALRQHHAEALNEGPVALINISLDTMDIALMREGRLVYARSVVADLRRLLDSWGGLQPEAADHAAHLDTGQLALTLKLIDCEKLFEKPGEPGAPPDAETAEKTRRWLTHCVREMRHTWDFARREMKCPPPPRLYVTGEGAAMKHLDRLLGAELDMEIEIFNPVASLACAKDVTLPFGGLSLTAAYGAALGALREGAVAMDLTPPAYYKAIARRRLLKRLTATSALFVIASVCSGAAFVHYRDIQSTQFKAYADINGRMTKNVKTLRDKDRKLVIIRRYLNDPNGALPVLESITGSSAVPGRVSIENFDFKRDNKVTIDATAKTIADMNEFIADLEDSGHFLDIRKSDPTQTKLHRVFSVYSFTLECLLDVKANRQERK